MEHTVCGDQLLVFPLNRKESKAVVKFKHIQLFSTDLKIVYNCLQKSQIGISIYSQGDSRESQTGNKTGPLQIRF